MQLVPMGQLGTIERDEKLTWRIRRLKGISKEL
jgi:hypothetical protein